MRELQSLEALTQVDTVVFDKTGTLTQNSMRVEEVFVDPANHSTFYTALALNNDADGDFGDPTELALLRAASEAGFDKTKLEQVGKDLRAEGFKPSIKLDEEHNLYTLTFSSETLGERVIDWPGNVISAKRLDNLDRDVILLAGTEPHLAWHTYADAIFQVCERFEVSGILTLGALLAVASGPLFAPERMALSWMSAAPRTGC